MERLPSPQTASNQNRRQQHPVQQRDGLMREALETHERKETQQDQQRQRPSAFVIRTTCIAGLGGILFGYDLGVISAALPHLTIDFDLSKPQEEWVVSILYVGGFLGAILGGSLCDAFGRKKSILITDVLFLGGAVVLFLAPTYGVVLQGRVIVGFAVAVSGIADVSYLHEIAPVEWRGSIVSVNEACISLGFLLAFTVGSILSELGSNDAWRLMFGLSGVVALIQLLGMWDMPESPRWLRECGRHEECAAALSRINAEEEQPLGASSDDQPPKQQHQLHYNSCPPPSVHDADGGLDDTTTPPDYRISAISSREDAYVPPTTTWRHHNCGRNLCFHYLQQVYFLGKQVGTFCLTTARDYPRQGWIMAFLSTTQQLCGQTSVLSYAPQIFASVSSSNDDDEGAASYVKGWTTVTIGIVKFLVTVLVIWKIETFGRRPLLLSGMSAIALGLLLLILASGINGSAVRGSKYQDNFDDANDESSSSSSQNGFGLAMSGILLVVCGYSMSFGPLTWLLTSELFPTEIRGRALGASSILNYGAAIAVTATFLSLQSTLGNTSLFAIFLFITVMGLLFALTAIPETKERSVPEIDAALDRLLWWRTTRTTSAATSQHYRSASGSAPIPMTMASATAVSEGRSSSGRQDYPAC